MRAPGLVRRPRPHDGRPPPGGVAGRPPVQPAGVGQAGVDLGLHRRRQPRSHQPAGGGGSPPAGVDDQVGVDGDRGPVAARPPGAHLDAPHPAVLDDEAADVEPGPHQHLGRLEHPAAHAPLEQLPAGRQQDVAVEGGEPGHPAGRGEPQEVGRDPQGHGPRGHEVGRDARDQALERREAARLEDVDMAALRNPGAGDGPLGQVVALDHGDPLDVAAERLGGGQPAEAGAHDDGVGGQRRAGSGGGGGGAAVAEASHRGGAVRPVRRRARAARWAGACPPTAAGAGGRARGGPGPAAGGRSAPRAGRRRRRTPR